MRRGEGRINPEMLSEQDKQKFWEEKLNPEGLVFESGAKVKIPHKEETFIVKEMGSGDEAGKVLVEDEEGPGNPVEGYWVAAKHVEIAD